tara:strand:+ start:93 stop:755 length:663 start_codon:yes stop_codon:yes gene_type:complete
VFKKLFTFFFLFLGLQVIGQDNRFVSTWAIPSNGYIFEFPLKNYSDITIDWGDGEFPTNHLDGNYPTHEYSSSGNYIIRVSVNDPSKNIGSMYLNGHDNRTLIQTITNWGEGKWGTWNNAFRGATGLTIPATDEPDLSLTTSMASAFRGCASLVGTTLNDWNVSTITDMYALFRDATAFNGNISSWNTANVTSMSNMFSYATVFNRDINKWGFLEYRKGD